MLLRSRTLHNPKATGNKEGSGVSKVMFEVFRMVHGTFSSSVLHLGNCNEPSTIQTIMSWFLQPLKGSGMFVYLDNTYVYYNSIEKHKQLLDKVLYVSTEAGL